MCSLIPKTEATGVTRVPWQELAFLHLQATLQKLHCFFTPDRDITCDLLIASPSPDLSRLVASFSKSQRCSYVNGVKIWVSPADLAHALKLPTERVVAGSEGAEEVQVKDVGEDAGGGDVKTAELEEQSLDLSLGQENADNKADEREKEEKVDADREDKTEVGLAEEKGVEKDNDSREEGGFEDVVKSRECKEEEEEQGGQWVLDAKNISGERFSLRCTVTEANEMSTGMQLRDDYHGEFLASRGDSHIGPSSTSIFGNVNKRDRY
ncbi:hypothetical protein NL676_017377 [Syzygium grande]|nr:hypothetical protein NL676_017377 [Syzygium grande]